MGDDNFRKERESWRLWHYQFPDKTSQSKRRCGFLRPCTATGATNPSAPARKTSSGASPQAATLLSSCPPGGGKALCYQLPAVLATQRTAVVVSPRIALMQDQVAQLEQMAIPADFLNSSLSRDQCRLILSQR